MLYVHACSDQSVFLQEGGYLEFAPCGQMQYLGAERMKAIENTCAFLSYITLL